MQTALKELDDITSDEEKIAITDLVVDMFHVSSEVQNSMSSR